MNGPPLQRIWAQHVELHRHVRALADWANGSDHVATVETARKLIGEVAAILPHHFALEEEGGYFADVLAVAPALAPRAEALRAHHHQLVPLVDGLLRDIEHTLPPDLEAFAARVADVIVQIESHEAGENALVRDAFSHLGRTDAQRSTHGRTPQHR